MTQWPDTSPLKLAGIWFRVVDQEHAQSDMRKKPGHKVLQWYTRNGWYEVPMTVGFLLADFFFQEENFLYPPEEGFQGGRRYLTDCAGAAMIGWEAAKIRLNSERALAADRRNGAA